MGGGVTRVLLRSGLNVGQIRLAGQGIDMESTHGLFVVQLYLNCNDGIPSRLLSRLE